MAVEACGRAKPMNDGHCVIEADEVNGTGVGHLKKKEKHAR